MKTININGQEFTIEQLNELIEQSKKSQHWTEKLLQPSKENYYFIGEDVIECFYSILSPNCTGRKPQHAFRTSDQAQLVADKCTLMVEMHNFAYAMNNGWIPDWKQPRQNKYGIRFIKEFKISYFEEINVFIFGIAVKSEEIAEQMLEEFKDRLEIYNQQF